MNKELLSRTKAIALSCVVVVSVFLGVFAFRETGLLQRAELNHYDQVLSWVSLPSQAPDVVIVAIEDDDLTEWGWPVPDGKLAQLIEAASLAGAKVIGLDIYRDNPVGPGTDALTEALETFRVVGISRLDAAGDIMIAPPADLRTSGRYGFTDVPIDFDGVARRSLLLVNHERGLRLSFPLKLAMVYEGMAGFEAEPNNPSALKFGQTTLPPLDPRFGGYRGLDAAGYQVMTRFVRRLPGAFVVPARQLIVGEVPSEHLASKTVIIGLTSDSIKDYFVTPLNLSSGARFAFGVELHAAAVQQLLDHASGRLSPIRTVSHASENGLILLAALFGAWAAWNARALLTGTFFGPGASLVLAGAASIPLKWGLWLPVVPITLAWILAFSAIYILIAVHARKQRRALAGLLSAHLSPELSQQIWRQRHEILAGGKLEPKKMFVTALYADIASSTRIGRSLKPDGFMDWISKVLDELAREAGRHGGFVEKFTGDGILVAFGAPLGSTTEEEQRADADAALRCARAIRAAVENLNSRTPSQVAYRIRIGLNSGVVIGGMIGRKDHIQYNLIGDTINVAARVEAWAKSQEDGQKTPVTICLTGQTAELCPTCGGFSKAGKLTHDNGVDEFEIFSLMGEP